MRIIFLGLPILVLFLGAKNAAAVTSEYFANARTELRLESSTFEGSGLDASSALRSLGPCHNGICDEFGVETGNGVYSSGGTSSGNDFVIVNTTASGFALSSDAFVSRSGVERYLGLGWYYDCGSFDMCKTAPNILLSLSYKITSDTSSFGDATTRINNGISFYPRGQIATSGEGTFSYLLSPDDDVVFSVFASAFGSASAVLAVPLPASLPFLAVSIMGLGFLRKAKSHG